MNTNKADSNQSLKDAETGLEQVLCDFRSSVHAWSDAELSRPRIASVTHRHTWRFAATWTLGCMVAVSSLTAGLYQHYRSQLVASNMQQPQIQQQFQARQAALSKQAGQRDENLMAVVDSDVSRPVPSAMEPLAQLMDESPDQ